ncbi:fimbria/pilus outer membrane usher protein [Roseomonas populi]|uniref:Fimbria/pilus outer membrane usher protein n=1 Tax=Roseomonas populi TaxID=3121582 RepID=A0ABT1X4I1_9PROT|nr:fimbria/pilus outer membrane usher protein [Roseomonas pecuniae]MCR0982681.1 fimbria/pilus outer membrane usher protein [Roseomonas pecuniae]
MFRFRGAEPGRTGRALLILVALALLPLRPARAEERVLLLDVVVNGRSVGMIGTFTERDGVLSARAEDLRSLGIAVSTGIAGETPIPLSKLPGMSFRLDEPNQQISFTAGDESLIPSELGRGGSAAPPPRAEATLGALLNYDINVTSAAGRTLGAGYFEGRIFGSAGVFSSDGLAYSSTGEGRGDPFVRLETSFVRDDEEALRQYRLGDFISGGLAWTRPVRLGGAQVSRSFSLRPDLVTFPVPIVSGSAAVPSTVDVLVNGVQQLSTTTGTGPFVVRQLPVITGAGEVSVRVRDALGRETTSTLPFYASSALLAPGLFSYSAELGFIRRNYGILSNDYGPLVGVGTLRYGVTNWLTAEAHAEGGADLQMGGAGAAMSIGALGSVTLSAAGSRARGRAGGDELGWQVGAGLERVSTGLSLGASVTWASARFADVAALEGASYPRRITRASASVPLLGGALSLAYADVRRDKGLRPREDERGLFFADLPSASILSATYSRSLFGRANFYATGYTDLSGNSGEGLLFGLSFALGDRTTVAATASMDQGRAYGGLQASRSAVAAGDLGWRAYAAEGGLSRQLGELEYKAPTGRVLAGVDRFSGETALRAEARGAITAATGGLFLSDTVQNSFAIVETGQSGVGVLQENRPVGRTDSRGRLLVTDLRAYERNRIGIVPGDVPPDATVSETSRLVTPRQRAGTVVRFPISRGASARVRLVDAAGKPLPLGSIALPTEGERLPVGYDGEVFMTRLQPSNSVEVQLPDGGSCQARFPFVPVENDLPLVGPVPCR